MRAAVIAAAGLVLSGGLACSEATPTPSVARARDRTPALDSAQPTPVARVDTLARGLQVPWAVAALPDGRLLLTERPGRIQVLDTASGERREWARLEVYAESPSWGPESGLLGLVLAPDFATSGHVYVFATRWRSAGDRSGATWRRIQRRTLGMLRREQGLPFVSEIIRFTERDGRGTDPRVIVSGLPANHYHAGGGLGFGPDGMLYASVGDVLHPELALASRSLAGKLLRYSPDGAVPADNPDPSSPVWASGLRNTQAFDWLSDGTMVGADHGPTGMAQEGGRAGRDELNVLQGGASYGWPAVVGWELIDANRPPLLVWREPIAPAGLASYRGPDPRLASSVFVAGLKGGVEHLRLAKDSSGAWEVAARRRLALPRLGRVRGVRSLSDGSLLVFTSNRDARGQPQPDDDLLLRVWLGGSS